MVSFAYEPHDINFLSDTKIDEIDHVMNRALMRLDDRWTLWSECQRVETTHYPDSAWPDVASRLIDWQRRNGFIQPGSQYVSRHFATLLYRPNLGIGGKLASIYDDTGKNAGEEAEVLRKEQEYFTSSIDNFHHQLGSISNRVEVLHGDDLATYLHSTASVNPQRIRMPMLADMGAEYLLDSDFTPGYEPVLGDHHIRIIKIKSQPDNYISGLLDSLNSFRFPMRIVCRWQRMSNEDSRREIEECRSLWGEKIIPWTEKVLKGAKITKTHDQSKENQAARMYRDATNRAMIALENNEGVFGKWVHTVALHDEDIDTLNDRVIQVEKVIRDAGFACKQVRGIDSMHVWIGTIPGHPQADLQKLNAYSLNIAKVMPNTSPWMGPDWDHRLDGPPLLRCLSGGATPFNLCLHQPGSTAGHAIVDGITGSGKSFLLGEMAAGHRRYKRSRVVFIDYLASAKGITYALGGTYYDLAKMSLQPLADIDDQDEMSYAIGWVIGSLEQEMGHEPTAVQKQEIADALRVLATHEPHLRTLTSFRALVQDEEIWDAIGTFCLGGAAGHILDSDRKYLGGGEDVLCFEMAGLIDHNKIAVGPVLAAVFHEIERNLDGRPTKLVVDEAQMLVRVTMFRRQLEKWLETARKRNCQVILATPDLTAFTESDDIVEIIKRGCQTQIFAANPGATDPSSAMAYHKMGLPDEHISVIAKLEKARQYFARCNDGCRVFELAASPVEVALCGKNSDPDKAAMDQIMQKYGKKEYLWKMLEYSGFSEEEVSFLRFHMGEAEPILNAAE